VAGAKPAESCPSLLSKGSKGGFDSLSSLTPSRGQGKASLPVVKRLGRVDYPSTWQAMRAFNDLRSESTCDEIWLLEHFPVYTLGLSGKREHVLNAGAIPLVMSDRGGQVTYHGPGQIVAYLLLDLRRYSFGVRELVRRMEAAVIGLLADYDVSAQRKEGAPGVYVRGAKIAALGLRVRRHCCYHGLAFNVDMNLEPFSRIDPCGYPGLAVTQARDCGIHDKIDFVADRLVEHLTRAIATPGDPICLK
jgi:lipoyl(octanoyl) transferase